jgi:hypothetical protein
MDGGRRAEPIPLGKRIFAATSEGVIMSNKSPQKANAKKPGQTLKEKRAAKKMKKIRLADNLSKVPPTGH